MIRTQNRTHKMSLAKNNKGFSLIELLVVVGIIGTLASIGVPKYQKYLAKSKMNAMFDLQSQINVAEEAYYTSADTYASPDVTGAGMTALGLPVLTAVPNQFTQPTGTNTFTQTTWSSQFVATALTLGICQSTDIVIAGSNLSSATITGGTECN